MESRHLSLSEANALLPVVRDRLKAAMQVHFQLRAILARLQDEGIPIGPDLLSGAVPGDLGRAGRRLVGRAQALYETLRDLVTEVEETGAQIKDLDTGLVDFRSFKDGHEEVWLCWRLGEPEIGYYHGLSAGFAGRQPVGGHRFTASPSPGRRDHP